MILHPLPLDQVLCPFRQELHGDQSTEKVEKDVSCEERDGKERRRSFAARDAFSGNDCKKGIKRKINGASSANDMSFVTQDERASLVSQPTQQSDPCLQFHCNLIWNREDRGMETSPSGISSSSSDPFRRSLILGSFLVSFLVYWTSKRCTR